MPPINNKITTIVRGSVQNLLPMDRCRGRLSLFRFRIQVQLKAPASADVTAGRAVPTLPTILRAVAWLMIITSSSFCRFTSGIMHFIHLIHFNCISTVSVSPRLSFSSDQTSNGMPAGLVQTHTPPSTGTRLLCERVPSSSSLTPLGVAIHGDRRPKFPDTAHLSLLTSREPTGTFQSFS